MTYPTRYTAGCCDPENARCCYHPEYKGRGRMMTCQTCGAKAPRHAAKILNDLPTKPGVPCRHENQKNTMVMGWLRLGILWKLCLRLPNGWHVYGAC